MIRHSIHTGVGRGRPELARLSEGISASLRQFSIAQARCASTDNDAPSRPSSSRQRSAAAASQLLSMNDGPTSKSNNRSPRADSANPAPAKGPQIPRVISVDSLRGGSQGRFSGFRKVSGGNSSGPLIERGGIITGGIVRGGFRGRGRGGGAFAGRGGSYFAGRRDVDVGGTFRPRRGRGGAVAHTDRESDDRQGQGRHQLSKEERAEERAYGRFKTSGADEDPESTAYNLAVETGVDQPFSPGTARDLLAELTNYAPSVATSATPLAKGSTVLTQARILGGGRPYHPNDWPSPAEAKNRCQQGPGVFFPSAEAKAWVNGLTRGAKYGNPPKETTTAVLDATVLGKYDGPKFVPPNDTLGTVSSYVKRHGTWTPHAEREIAAKIKSLLPSAAAPKGAARATGKKA